MRNHLDFEINKSTAKADGETRFSVERPIGDVIYSNGGTVLGVYVIKSDGSTGTHTLFPTNRTANQ